jgi:DNA integrity scanning protein DisA with diadenylate cyclase activity
LTLDEELRRAQQAKELLEHPLLIEVFDVLRRQVLDTWKNSAVRDAEGRERLFMAIRIVEQVEGLLREYVTTGKFAAMQLEALRKGTTNEFH